MKKNACLLIFLSVSVITLFIYCNKDSDIGQYISPSEITNIDKKNSEIYIENNSNYSNATENDSNVTMIANFIHLKDNNYISDEYKVISYIQNNTQYCCYEYMYTLDKEKIITSVENSNNKKILNYKDYYTSDSTDFEKIQNIAIIKYTGNIRLSGNKVKYINYIQDETAQPKQTWIDYVSDILEERCGNTDTPIIITESWSAYCNGHEVTVLTATNVIAHNKTNLQSTNSELLPYGENHIMYKLSVIFIDGKGEILTYPEHHKIYTTPINTSVSYNDENFSDISFAPANNGEHTNTYYYTYQYNKNKDIEVYPVFFSSGGFLTSKNYSYYPYVIFMNIDFDEEDEILFYNPSSTSLGIHLSVYQIDAGHLVQEYVVY